MKKDNRLYIVPDGGIGNRLRALVSGIRLAGEVELRPVVVWHSDSLCQASLADIINVDLVPAEIVCPGELVYRALYEVPRRRNLKIPSLLAPLRFVRLFYDEKNLLPYLDDGPRLLSEVKASKGDVLFFSGQEFYDFPRDYFRRIVKPSDEVVARADEILNGHSPDFTVQIRRTDNTQSIAQSPEGKFMDIVETNPAASFFLATDSEEVKDQFRRRFGERIFTNSRAASRSSREGIIDAMAEILIMSRTRKIFASYASSFPHIASWLSGTAIETVRSN